MLNVEEFLFSFEPRKLLELRPYYCKDADDCDCGYASDLSVDQVRRKVQRAPSIDFVALLPPFATIGILFVIAD